jgi:putative Mg2+ transporter-C (MgtC) family protein
LAIIPFLPAFERNRLQCRRFERFSHVLKIGNVLDFSLNAESLRTALDILLKMGIGALLGGAIGWERELSGRPAGTRTHMLVVVGVVLFAECSRFFPSNDPSRIAAQIVTGIGFLGAGTILRHGTQIRGLTTAASIWAAAAIGMAISIGGALLIVAPIATVLTILTLTLVEKIEERYAQKGHRRLAVAVSQQEALESVVAEILRAAPDIRNVSFQRTGDSVLLVFRVQSPTEDLPLRLASLPFVESARWTE